MGAASDDASIRPDYESQNIRLSDLVVTGDSISEKVFSNCHLFGPSTLIPLGGVTLSGCSFEAAPEDLVIVITGDRPVYGAIGLSDCAFYNCQFSRWLHR